MGEAYLRRRGGGFDKLTELPLFTYTGQHELIDEENGNFRIKFLTSGTLTITKLNSIKNGIDVFCVGAGGGAAAKARGAGGGGYTKIQKNVAVNKNVEYVITIGGGVTGGNGGNTAAFGVTASGGYGTSGFSGGNGGSGGGAYSAQAHNSNGGANGSDGYGDNVPGKGQINVSGPNSETGNTYEFGESSSGTLYAGGGGAVRADNGEYAPYISSSGGAGGGGYHPGGGNGAYQDPTRSGYGGTVNTGGGGGGYNTAGGSGIVVIRNRRESA